ncbi:MAG: VOC family protein [Acidobacteriota bacterium]
MQQQKNCAGLLGICWLVLAGLVGAAEIEIDPKATIENSPTTLLGVSHIGLSVKDLGAVLPFYQEATRFELLRRGTLSGPAADALFARPGVEADVAVLRAPNMLFELVEFRHNADAATSKRPFEGPGMTHTCFQTTAADSGYERFRKVGSDMLTRGEAPIDLAGRGVTYAYGYDPEGNMFEMEQLDPALIERDPLRTRWLEEGHSAWMTQVAMATHDLERLVDWYQKVLAFSPSRQGDFVEHPGMIQVADHDGLSLRVAWFQLAQRTKTLELWQMRVPETQEYGKKRGLTDLGYSYSLEVGDIQAEYRRMKELGVEFVSEPIELSDRWQVYAHDIDGNVFALRQWVDPESPHSVAKLDH